MAQDVLESVTEDNKSDAYLYSGASLVDERIDVEAGIETRNLELAR